MASRTALLHFSDGRPPVRETIPEKCTPLHMSVSEPRPGGRELRRFYRYSGKDPHTHVIHYDEVDWQGRTQPPKAA